MRLESIQQAKADIFSALSVDRVGVSAQATDESVSVGVTRRGTDEEAFKAAIFASSPELGRLALEAVNGEGEVHIVPHVTTRVTRDWVQRERRPLEIGQQIRPEGANWVGTGSLFIRSGQTTNRHVAGMNARLGDVMLQGNKRYGEVSGLGPISFTQRNRYDVAIVRVDEDIEARLRWDWGLLGDVRYIRTATPDDIGREAVNTGQTIGTQRGYLYATGVDNVPVGYDEGVAWYDDLLVFMRDGGPFSVGGHSGSAIHMVHDSACVALLFAGGPDSSGRDLTYACDMAGAIRHAGHEPVLPE